MLVRISGDHNHDNDIAKKTVKDKENQAVEEAARNPTVSPRTVLANLTNNLRASNPINITYMSKFSTFTKRVQRERNKLLACPDMTKLF